MKQQEGDSKKRIAFPIQLFAEGSADVQIPDVIQVVPVGKWDHPAYGEMEITSAHIGEFVKNFKDKVRLDIPINAGHDNGMSGGELPAIGWFTDVEDRGVKGLWAGVKWTEEGERLLKQRAFKYFSPEFYQDYEDPETRKKYGHVLVGGPLTNKPYFKELKAVVSFSEPSIIHQFTDDMTINDIVSKKVEELSAEEKAFLAEHKDELNDDQKAAFASVLEAGDDKGGDDDGSGADDGNGDGGDDGQGDTGDQGVSASEKNKGKQILMSAAEADALSKAANDGVKALEKIEASERRELIGKMVFSTTNTAGRFLPKQQGALDSFIKTLSERQRDAFVQLVNNMPKADTSMFSEIGDGGKTEGDNASGIAAKVRKLATEKVTASEGKTTYAAAVVQLFAEQPELKKEYDAALEAGNL